MPLLVLFISASLAHFSTAIPRHAEPIKVS